ncbi:MAG: hypothetical protein R2848_00120 [Thermomicrobiales bacterium]
MVVEPQEALEPEQPAAGATAPDALAVVPVEVMVDLEQFEDENGFVDAEAWFRERDRVWAEARLKEIGKAGVRLIPQGENPGLTKPGLSEAENEACSNGAMTRLRNWPGSRRVRRRSGWQGSMPPTDG